MTKAVDVIDHENDDSFPKKAAKSYNFFATMLTKPGKGKTYSDQTGRFPYQSLRGNKYLFVLYDYDSNVILVEALKNRTASSLTKA